MFTYLLINLFSFLSTVIFAFDKRLNFYKNWPRLAISTTVVAVPMLFWDALFTHSGVWGFSGEYLTGIYIFNLPLEEVLFFFAIPYSCMFIFEVVKKYYPAKKEHDFLRPFLFFLGVMLFAIGMSTTDKTYTSYNFIICSIVIFITTINAGDNLGKFMVTFGLTMIPFLIVNGLLTSGISAISDNPIVWYNNGENLALRIGSIPVEDIFFSLTMLMGNFLIYEEIDKLWKEKSNSQ